MRNLGNEMIIMVTKTKAGQRSLYQTLSFILLYILIQILTKNTEYYKMCEDDCFLLVLK